MQKSLGFTVVEMFTTTLVIGLVAAFAVPFLMTPVDSELFEFIDRTREALRFAQKSALTKRRTVCVNLAGGTLTLLFSPLFDGLCSLPLLHPSEGQPFSQTVPKGFTITDAHFNFSAIGRPMDAAGRVLATQAILIKDLNHKVKAQVIVEAETGYVHTVLQ